MRIIIFVAVIICCGRIPTSAQEPEPGTSTAVWGSAPTVEQLRQARAEGIRQIEVALNQCYRGIPEEEQLPRMKAMKAAIDSANMQVWSVHLPFSRTLDISVSDDLLREENVKFLARMIRLSGEFYVPRRFVLHPSSEPIVDAERRQRIDNAISSIRALKTVADEIGIPLCIENLPRTCLGNTPEELLGIVDAVPGVGICFDTNHCTRATTDYFIDIAGERIHTVHMSDYDYVYERHWLPYEGKIGWARFLKRMKEIAHYEGIWMYEVRHTRPNREVTTTRDVAETFQRMTEEYQKLKHNR